jgi:hypothetical protein
MINIIEKINSYTHSGNKKCNIGLLVNPIDKCEWVEIIEFENRKGEVIKLELYGQSENTRITPINENNFDHIEFDMICQTFNLDYFRQINRHAIRTFNQRRFYLSFASKPSKDSIYGVIFYLWDGDSRQNPELFIDGIFEFTTQIENLKSI